MASEVGSKLQSAAKEFGGVLGSRFGNIASQASQVFGGGKQEFVNQTPERMGGDMKLDFSDDEQEVQHPPTQLPN